MFWVYSKVIESYVCVCVCVYKYIYIYVYIYIYYIYLVQIPFYYRLLQDTRYSSWYYTVGLCCLSILYILMCISELN